MSAITALTDATRQFAAMPNKGPWEASVALTFAREIIASCGCLDPGMKADIDFDLGRHIDDCDTAHAQPEPELDGYPQRLEVNYAERMRA